MNSKTESNFFMMFSMVGRIWIRDGPHAVENHWFKHSLLSLNLISFLTKQLSPSLAPPTKKSWSRHCQLMIHPLLTCSMFISHMHYDDPCALASYNKSQVCLLEQWADFIQLVQHWKLLYQSSCANNTQFTALQVLDG